MKCSRCGGTNVTVTTLQEEKTTVRSTGILYKLTRAMLVIFTCGLWALIPKKKESGKNKYKRVDYCMCLSCGNKWKMRA